MMQKMRGIALLGSCLFWTFVGVAQAPAANPEIKRMVDEVSEERIRVILTKLESFGTRNTLSTKAVPARNWIADELRGYSPRLKVSFDTHRVRKAGRITRDVEMANVVAVLPGSKSPDRQVLITAHYDTMAIRQPAPGTTPGDVQPLDPESPAPGVDDDGSGTAAVMELARVMSRREFDKTLVFVLFVAEEQGLVGSTLFAEAAHKEKRQIEAVLNNDIIGTTVSGNGETDNHTVRVFSEDPADSASREVARYVKDAGERYVPSMTVDLVFRPDRWSRGGDHTPFNQEGYAAVRFSSAEEDYSHQHTPTDTLAFTDVPYVTRVARVNCAAAALIALAPKSPSVMEVIQRGTRKGQLSPMISRGKSRYDAQLRWNVKEQEPGVAGYIVLIRSTTDALWQRRLFVGKVSEYGMPGVSIDDFVFGVQAVDADGNASIPSVYVATPRRKLKVETY